MEGDAVQVREFKDSILENAPPASLIKSLKIRNKPITGYDSFTITGSKSHNNKVTEISPDIAVCHDCLYDLLSDPERIDYPLVNCTNCGPRFTIIEDLPYDRENTTMRDFILCKECSSEYNDISDRRFHAQPVACNKCGPHYIYKKSGSIREDIDEIISGISGDVMSGRIIAVKGLGGYHL
ncbi:MAG: carbamoyltransferase HypF, partial [Odoribacter sp.]|nr:carbamoyltransferase HypF [Odoribacter sp.]